MFIFKFGLPAMIFAGVLFTGGQISKTEAEAQASTLITDATAARDAHTYPDDIMLTNSCIESGDQKEHCLCVTKIFKHEMTVRQYHAAAYIYASFKSTKSTALMSAKMSLKQQGYSDSEITAIHKMNARLSGVDGFKARCTAAQGYFASVER